MERIVQLDSAITLWLNGLHNPYFDIFFWHYTDLVTWIPLFIMMVYAMWREYGMRSLAVLVGVAVVILLADQISSSVIKPLVARPRPTHDESLSDLIHVVNGYRGGAFGFVSSHSANAFGVAMFTALVFRSRIYSFAIFSWAILTAYSRIYLGVHYLGDVLCGAFLGFLVAFLTYYTLVFLTKRFGKLKVGRLGKNNNVLIVSVLVVITISLLFLPFLR